MYTFFLLEQNQRFDSNGDMDPTKNLRNYLSNDNPMGCPSFPSGCLFELSRMMTDFSFTIRGVNWFFAEQDAFSRMRLYKEWNVMKPGQVCNGLRGYDEPCPERRECEREGDSREDSREDGRPSRQDSRDVDRSSGQDSREDGRPSREDQPSREDSREDGRANREDSREQCVRGDSSEECRPNGGVSRPPL